MNNINEIYGMLDWNNDVQTQQRGIQYANEMNDIAAFIQPIVPNYNKNIWDNCAQILYSKTDDELKPYLLQLFEWMQDMNWPGAFTICDRLSKFENKEFLNSVKQKCKNIAIENDDLIWLGNLDAV